MKKARTEKRQVKRKVGCDLSDPELNRKPKDGYGFIYKYTFKNGKCYIGQTTNSNKIRIRNHCYCNDYPVDRAIRSGAKFNVDILSEVPMEYLDDAERYCIAYFNTLVPNGYNLISGGKQFRMSDELKKRIGIKSKEYWIGMNETQKKKRMTPLINSRKIKIICIETGEIYESMNEAARKNNTSAGHIHNAIHGIRHTAGGYHWTTYSKTILQYKNEIVSYLTQFEKEIDTINRRKLPMNFKSKKV